MNSLQRFLDAQKENTFIALREMKERRKRTHWIWNVSPVLKGQGQGSMARHYCLDGQEEAQSFQAYSFLGKRLWEIKVVVLTHPDKSILFIMFSSTDSWKLFDLYDHLRRSL